MERTILLEKIKALNDATWHDQDNEERYLESIETLIEAYLQKHPNDSALLIRLAMTVFCTPIMDDVKAVACLKKALTYEPNNALALASLAYIEIISYSASSDETFALLNNFFSDNQNDQSMIEYLKALYYKSKNNWLYYYQYLKESVILSSEHVNNMSELGQILITTGHSLEGKEFIRRAIKNIKSIYHVNDPINIYDLTDANNFLNEFVRGTHTTESRFERIKKSLDN